MLTRRFSLFIWNKIHRNRVHAVPNILLRKTLTQKHMPQMRPTIGTGNLRAKPIRINTPLHRTRNLIIKTWPPTVSLKLALRTIKRRTTTLTHIRALLPKRKILTRKRHLRTLTHNNPLLLPRQLPVLSFLIRQNTHQNKQTIPTLSKKPPDSKNINTRFPQNFMQFLYIRGYRLSRALEHAKHKNRQMLVLP